MLIGSLMAGSWDAIEKELTALGVNNMPGLTVYFMGTADVILDTAWKNRNVYAETEEEKPVDSNLIKEKEDRQEVVSKLEAKKASLESTIETVKEVETAVASIKGRIKGIEGRN